MMKIDNIKATESEGGGEVAFFSAKRWDPRNRADLIDSATPCHDAQVVLILKVCFSMFKLFRPGFKVILFSV